jgi:hypothetical protein
VCVALIQILYIRTLEKIISFVCNLDEIDILSLEHLPDAYADYHENSGTTELKFIVSDKGTAILWLNTYISCATKKESVEGKCLNEYFVVDDI